MKNSDEFFKSLQENLSPHQLPDEKDKKWDGVVDSVLTAFRIINETDLPSGKWKDFIGFLYIHSCSRKQKIHPDSLARLAGWYVGTHREGSYEDWKRKESLKINKRGVLIKEVKIPAVQ